MTDWQTISVILIVAFAAAYVARRILRRLLAFTKSNAGSCATGCGKCSTASAKRAFSKVKNR